MLTAAVIYSCSCGGHATFCYAIGTRPCLVSRRMGSTVYCCVRPPSAKKDCKKKRQFIYIALVIAWELRSL